MSTSFGIEVGLPTSIFADEVSLGDPVLDTPPLSDETESSENEDDDEAEDATAMDSTPEIPSDSRNDRSNLIQSNPLPKKEPEVISKPKRYWDDLSGWGVPSFKPITRRKARPPIQIDS